MKHSCFWMGTIVNFVKEMKTLGVFFADVLIWSHHIKHVQTKLNKVNGLMNRLFLQIQTKIAAYNSFFLSTINYCHLVWGITLQQYIEKRMIVHWKAVRIMSNIPWFFSRWHLFWKIQHHESVIHKQLEISLACTYGTTILTSNMFLLQLFYLGKLSNIQRQAEVTVYFSGMQNTLLKSIIAL